MPGMCVYVCGYDNDAVVVVVCVVAVLCARFAGRMFQSHFMRAVYTEQTRVSVCVCVSYTSLALLNSVRDTLTQNRALVACLCLRVCVLFVRIYVCDCTC